MAMIPHNRRKRGIALLVAIIFMSVMLAFGLTLSSLAYKQEILASTAIDSQEAFYAADAGLECLLFYDQQQDLFALPANPPSSAPSIICDGVPAVAATVLSYTSGSQWVVFNRLSLDSGQYCADVTIYKPSSGSSALTYLFSQGYSTSCTTVATQNGGRFSSRGLEAHY